MWRISLCTTKKRQWAFLLPLDGMLVHRRVKPPPSPPDQVYAWTETGTEKCPNNTTHWPPSRLEPRALQDWGHPAFTRWRKKTFIQQWVRIKQVNRTRYSSEKPWSPSICIRSTCLSKSSIGTGWRPRRSKLTGVQRQTKVSSFELSFPCLSPIIVDKEVNRYAGKGIKTPSNNNNNNSSNRNNSHIHKKQQQQQHK